VPRTSGQDCRNRQQQQAGDLLSPVQLLDVSPDAGQERPEPRAQGVAQQACAGEEQERVAQPEVDFSGRAGSEPVEEDDVQAGLGFAQAQERRHREAAKKSGGQLVTVVRGHRRGHERARSVVGAEIPMMT